jgi:predicted phosphoribosyltransferase
MASESPKVKASDCDNRRTSKSGLLNAAVVEHLHIAPSVIDATARREEEELRRRELLYHEAEAVIDFTNRTVILVDDGLATGSTMRAAIAAVRQHRAARIIVAVPVAAADTLSLLENEVDEIACPLVPSSFQAVGQWYEQFDQTTDDEVRELLAQARRI